MEGNLRLHLKPVFELRDQPPEILSLITAIKWSLSSSGSEDMCTASDQTVAFKVLSKPKI